MLKDFENLSQRNASQRLDSATRPTWLQDLGLWILFWSSKPTREDDTLSGGSRLLDGVRMASIMPMHMH